MYSYVFLSMDFARRKHVVLYSYQKISKESTSPVFLPVDFARSQHLYSCQLILKEVNMQFCILINRFPRSQHLLYSCQCSPVFLPVDLQANRHTQTHLSNMQSCILFNRFCKEQTYNPVFLPIDLQLINAQPCILTNRFVRGKQQLKRIALHVNI